MLMAALRRESRTRASQVGSSTNLCKGFLDRSQLLAVTIIENSKMTIRDLQTAAMDGTSQTSPS